METEIDLKKVGLYLIIPFILSTLLLIANGSFVFIAVIQFLVGLVQVFISIVKTLVYAFNSSKFPIELKFYWLAVLLYFVLGGLGTGILNYLEIDSEVIADLGLIYFALAWTIALYHFKHIMPLKI